MYLGKFTPLPCVPPQEDPLLDWSKKYTITSKSRSLPVDQISLFGKEILEAIHFLRHKVGFSSLGHVHTGNIFVTTDQHCRLGGYDNALLSYRTRIYRSCEEAGLIKSIDMVMFGKLAVREGILFKQSFVYEQIVMVIMSSFRSCDVRDGEWV